MLTAPWRRQIATLYGDTFTFLDAMASPTTVDACYLGFQVHVHTAQILNLRHEECNAFLSLQELAFLCT